MSSHRTRDYTTKEVAKVLELFRQGVPAADIAAEIGRPVQSVYYLTSTVRADLGTDDVPYRQTPWTLQEDAHLLYLWRRGDDLEAIARGLCRTVPSVHLRIVRLRKQHGTDLVPYRRIYRHRGPRT